MNIVLTGAASYPNGKTILRADLVAACKKADIKVQTAVEFTTNILVASRHDTVKAKNAKNLGVQVIDYAELIDLLGEMGVKIESTGAQPDPYVDGVPDFTKDFDYGAFM